MKSKKILKKLSKKTDTLSFRSRPWNENTYKRDEAARELYEIRKKLFKIIKEDLLDIGCE